MTTYMCLKAVGKSNAVVIDISIKGKQKGTFVSGNIPKLCHGMLINLELVGNTVVDYTLLLTQKNRDVLQKAKIDVEKYQETLNRHMMLKSEGITWEQAEQTVDDIYNKLPFGEADKLHKAIINNPTDPVRIKAINKRIVEGARRRRKIAYKIEEYLSYFDAVEQEGAYQQLMVSLKMMCLQASQYGLKSGNIWDNELKKKEEFVTANIKQRLNAGCCLLTPQEIADYLNTVEDTLEQEQLDTLWCLQDSLPCIITGGAGTGKTTVIQTLIDCYSRYYSKDNILLIAPTGKASRRIAEKTNYPASTIHKALRKTPEDDFIYYKDNNPLPHKLIIIDESSMIDTELMYDLLNAVAVTSKIIFVGDHNQLYPVGYGEPFFDFQQELKVYRLTINHRQAEETDILANATNVLEGKPLFTGNGVTVKDIAFGDIGTVLALADFDCDKDTQIISPFNYINAQINWFFKKGKCLFNKGDKVIMTKNAKEYCNGDVGYVVNLDKKSITVDIDGRQVVVPYNNPLQVVDVADADEAAKYFDESVAMNKETDIMLAYSITVHKMQGSEADRVVVFLPKDDTGLVTGRMLYTAVTRARKELEVYYYE